MIKWFVIVLLAVPRIIYSTIKLKIMRHKPEKYDLASRYKVLRATVIWICTLARMDIDVENREYISKPHSEGRLYVSNHRRLFDTMVFIYLSEKPLTLIVKKEVIKVPFLNEHAKAIETLFIDRGDLRQSLKVCKEAGQKIQNGTDIVIFAEGTRTKDGNVAPFRAALPSIVSYAKTDTTLVTMYNTEKPLSWRWITYPREKVNVKIFEPLSYDFYLQNRKHFTEVTRDMVQEQLEVFRKVC